MINTAHIHVVSPKEKPTYNREHHRRMVEMLTVREGPREDPLRGRWGRRWDSSDAR